MASSDPPAPASTVSTDDLPFLPEPAARTENLFLKAFFSNLAGARVTGPATGNAEARRAAARPRGSGNR